MTETEHIKPAMAKWKLIYIMPLIAVYAFVFSLAYLYVEGIFCGRGHFVWRPYIIARLNPKHELLPGTKGPIIFSANSRGLRGGEFSSADLSILVLGGSTAEGHYLDDNQTWPQILAKELNAIKTFGKVSVGNAGKAGLGVRHYRLQAESLLPQFGNIDIVAILTGPNDLLSFINNPEWSDDTPSKQVDSAAFHRVVSPYAPWSYALVKEEFSYLKILAKNQTRRLLTVTHIMKNRRSELVQDSDGKTYANRRKRRMAANKIEFPNDLQPQLERRLAAYERRLRETVAVIIQNNAVPILLTHPLNYSPDMPDSEKNLWWEGRLNYKIPGIDKEIYLSESSVADLIGKFNDVARKIAAENPNKVMLIDLADILRGKHGIYYDEWHFNIEGARQVGRILAAEIIANEQVVKGR